MKTTTLKPTLREAFGDDPAKDWPEWLRLATPRQQDLLARAIDEPNALTDTEWDELAEGPTACGLYNLQRKGILAVAAILVVAAVIAVVLRADLVASICVAFSLGLFAADGWFGVRYYMRLRRARREQQTTIWPGA